MHAYRLMVTHSHRWALPLAVAGAVSAYSYSHAIVGGRGEKVTRLAVVFLPVVQGEGRIVHWEKNVSTASCASLSSSGLHRACK